MFTRTTTLMGLTLAAAGIAFSAGAATIPLASGDYVRTGVQCRDAPFAALISFDGQNFSGAHSRDCNTAVLSAHGRRYALQSTCRALGDGTPAAAYTEAQTVRVQSARRFVFTHVNGSGMVDRAAYRLCTRPQS